MDATHPRVAEEPLELALPCDAEAARQLDAEIGDLKGALGDRLLEVDHSAAPVGRSRLGPVGALSTASL